MAIPTAGPRPDQMQPGVDDLSLKHLQAELARIDILIRREVRRWQLANQDAADSFRGFYVSHEDAIALFNRAFATSWGQSVTLPPAEAQAFTQAEAAARSQAQAIVAQAEQAGHRLRLTHLSQTFQLTPFEVDALLICLAPTLDLRYEQLYGYLQDHVARKRPGINLVLNLLAEAGVGRLPQLSYFGDEAPLLRHFILKRVNEPNQIEPPLLSQTLVVDPTIVAWLWGDYQPAQELGPFVKLLSPRPSEEEATMLPVEIRHNLSRLDHRPLLIFHGVDRGSQETAAKFVAAQAGHPLLLADLAAVIGAQGTPLRALRLALRDARLTGAIPCLLGWDAYLDEGNKRTPPHILAELCDFPDLVIVAGQENWQTGGLARQRAMFRQIFDIPDYAQRRSLWQHYLSGQGLVAPSPQPSPARRRSETSSPLGLIERGVSPNGTRPDPTRLADQFYLTADQIRDAVSTALDTALQRNADLTEEDLFAAARLHSSTRLSSLAQKIRPRYDWDDIILPEDQRRQLREIVDAVRSRAKVLELWEVGHKLASSRGVTILFAGPPGTGKTMAAEVMAGNLGLDLYRVDLSTIISKYIGETEKNLERIFQEAEHSNAILFFDEADSLFGKRSEVRDAHDRFANIEVAYLLQRMEAYDGMTILATNLRANLDEAFTRRLHYAVAFPFPEEEDRRRIWQTLFPATVPRDPALDLDVMARRFKLAGGNIRNIIVNAAYLAAADGDRVTMAHLLHSTARELQKMGRIVKDVDMRQPDA